MKKKILFIIPNLKSGGAEKSLVTLLQLFDYERFDVSLFLFRKEGVFLEFVPPEVRIITAGDYFDYFDGDAKRAFSFFLKKFRFDLIFYRCLYARSLKNKDSYKQETSLWKYLKKSINIPAEHFDCIIGYLEGTANWLACDMQAEKKIGYLHSYLPKTGSDKKNFIQMIKGFDDFVAVSDKVLSSLNELAPDYSRFHKIQNIVSPSFAFSLSDQKTEIKKSGLTILTVGRMFFEKGIDIAVDACKILVDRGYEFKWYHIGTGAEKPNITKQIAEYKLEDSFILLGEKANPYPYFKLCDIYVQPSRSEGWGITVTEAKIFNRPIVVTRFPSVYEQILHEKNGLICDIDAESVASAVERLINDENLRNRLSQSLSEEKIGNEEEIQKLYDLIES